MVAEVFSLAGKKYVQEIFGKLVVEMLLSNDDLEVPLPTGDFEGGSKNGSFGRKAGDEQTKPRPLGGQVL